MKCLMVMFVSVLAAVALAQGPSQGGLRRGPVGSENPLVRAALNPKIVEQLGLTEEQKAKLKSLEDDRDVMKALQEKVRKGTKRQADLLAAEKIDEAAVMTAMDEVFEARKELAKRQMKRLIAVKSIMTPEQVKAATEALKAQRGAKRVSAEAGKAEKAKKRAQVGKKAKEAKTDE